MLKKLSTIRIIQLFLIILIIVSMFVSGQYLNAQEKTAKECNAANKIWLQVPIPVPTVGQCVTGFPQYIEAIYNLFIGIVGIIAVIMIMLGGFQWLMAAGNAQKISGAKTTIISAVMGLVLALTSFTILNLINPQLKILKLTVDDVKSGDAGAVDTCKEGYMFVKSEDQNKQYFECGKTYEYYKYGDVKEKCAGFMCCEQPANCGLICVNNDPGDNMFSNAQCKNTVLIDGGNDGYGAGGWEVSRLYLQRYNCGFLYAYKTLTDMGRIIGSHCTADKYCYVNQAAGHEFSTKADDLSIINIDYTALLTANMFSSDPDPVGRFINFSCYSPK